MGLPEGDPGGQAEVAALQQGLSDLGWVAGHTVHIDYRWPGGDVERARAFAKEMVALKPDVLVTRSTPGTLALKAETSTIPIVFVSITEPILSGLVERLGRPGGNITGFTNFEPSLGGKLMELLKEVSPRLKRVTFLYNPDTAPYAQTYLRSGQAAASTLTIEPVAGPVHNDADIEAVIAALAREPGGGLIGIPDSFVQQRRDLVIALVARYQLPAIYANRDWTPRGGLMSYAVDVRDLLQRAAAYIDRILQGAKPGDLPVQSPTKFEFVINLKTAKALRLDIPAAVLAIADEVIE